MSGISIEQERERRRFYKQGLTDEQIAESVGCSKSAIWGWRQSNKLVANRPPSAKLQPLTPARMILYQLGYTDWQIAKFHGKHRNTVQDWR